MCYHTKQTATPAELKERFKATFSEEGQYKPSEAINGFSHPFVPVITSISPWEIQLFQWGLLPTWAKDASIQDHTLNAKVETLTEKPSFQDYTMQHCIIPITGFYEWKWLNSSGTKKEKYLIESQDDRIFSLAGIWNQCKHPMTGQRVNTFTILTTAADEWMAEIHNSRKRMPVMLSRDGEWDWLFTQQDPRTEHRLRATKLQGGGQISLF